MPQLTEADPERFLVDFFTSFTDALLSSEDDAAIVDRFYTPDIVQCADGHRMDRDKLIAHTRPVRKMRPEGRMEVHEALVDGDRLAARYTMHVRAKKKPLTVEVYFFGEFAPDGRMRSSHMLTRTLTPEAEDAGDAGDAGGTGDTRETGDTGEAAV